MQGLQRPMCQTPHAKAHVHIMYNFMEHLFLIKSLTHVQGPAGSPSRTAESRQEAVVDAVLPHLRRPRLRLRRVLQQALHPT